MKIIRICIFIFLASLSINLFSQDYITEDGSAGNKPAPKEKWTNRMVFGGNFMILPSSYYGYNEFYMELSPLIGYKVTDRLIAGNYFIFMYYSNEYYNFKTSMYGFKPFLRYRAIKNIDDILPFSSNLNTGITLVASQEFLNVERSLFLEGEGRRWIAATFAGFSIEQPLGKKGGFFISILWQIAGDKEFILLNGNSATYVNFGFYL